MEGGFGSDVVGDASEGYGGRVKLVVEHNGLLLRELWLMHRV